MPKQNTSEISQGSTKSSHHSSSTSTKGSSSYTKTSTTARVQKSSSHHSHTPSVVKKTSSSKFGKTPDNAVGEPTSFFSALPTYLRVLIIVALIVGAIGFYIYVVRKKTDKAVEDSDEESEIEENEERAADDKEEEQEKHVRFEDAPSPEDGDAEPRQEFVQQTSE